MQEQKSKKNTIEENMRTQVANAGKTQGKDRTGNQRVMQRPRENHRLKYSGTN